MCITQRVCLVQQFSMMLLGFADQRIGVLEEVIPLGNGDQLSLLSENVEPVTYAVCAYSIGKRFSSTGECEARLG